MKRRSATGSPEERETRRSRPEKRSLRRRTRIQANREDRPGKFWPMTHRPEPGGTVVTYSCRASRHHESVTLRELARRLASIKGYDFAEEFDRSRHYLSRLY